MVTKEEFKNKCFCPCCGIEGTISIKVGHDSKGVTLGQVVCINLKCDLSVNGRVAYLTYG